MARVARFVRSDKSTVYHVVSRTALPGLPLSNSDKDYLLGLIRKLATLYCTDILGFCIMGNHFHLVCRMHPASEVSDIEIQRRYKAYYGEEQMIAGEWIEHYRERLTNLGSFVKDIKQGFTRYYNRKTGRKGFFWGERFKSVIVEEGKTLINLLAYIDLNPIRAGMVKRPEDYRWSSLGYHVQTGNKDDLLSLDFGLRDWDEHDPQEIVRKYREFVYETGAVAGSQWSVVGSQKKGRQGIEQKIVNRERKRKYRVSRTERFLYRTRYFTDAGIIGSKEFVGEVFDQVKHMLRSKNERRFKPVGGIDGVYSMKGLVAE